MRSLMIVTVALMPICLLAGCGKKSEPTAADVKLKIGNEEVGQSPEFESDYITVKTQGAGPDVILLHGFASSPDVWSGVAKKIDPRFRLHLVYVAGLAGSPAAENVPESYLKTVRDEIVRYIEARELKKPILIGHSMGGLVSLLVASKEPAAVGKVIIVDALPFFSLLFNPVATSEEVLPFAMAWEKQTATLDDAQFEDQAKSSIAILTKQQERRDLLLKWSKESDRKAYSQFMRETMAYDARPELKNITCPVIVIYAYDEAMPVPEAQVIQLYTSAYADLKDVRFRPVLDSFHFIMWDQPEEFLKTLNEVLPAINAPRPSSGNAEPTDAAEPK